MIKVEHSPLGKNGLYILMIPVNQISFHAKYFKPIIQNIALRQPFPQPPGPDPIPKEDDFDLEIDKTNKFILLMLT